MKLQVVRFLLKANFYFLLHRNSDKALGTAILSEQDLFCGFGFVLCHDVTITLICKVGLPAHKDL